MADDTADIDALLADDAEASPDNFTQLRNHAKSVVKDNRDLRARIEQLEPQARNAALRDAGIDPKSPRAAAVLELHKGELTGEAVKETATRYGLVDDAGGSSDDGATQSTLTPEQQAAIDAHQRGTDVANQALPPTDPQDINAQIQAAQAKGDWSEVDRLNTVKRTKMLDGAARG